MTRPRGFLEIGKKKERERDAHERTRDWREITLPASMDEVREQSARCMDCGVPFCHRGCPLGNLIPEWNELISEGRIEDAGDERRAGIRPVHGGQPIVGQQAGEEFLG